MKAPSKDKNELVRSVPTDKAGVLKVANQWYRPERVELKVKAIENLPQDTIMVPSEAGFILLENEHPLLEKIAFSVAVNSINYMFWQVVDGQVVRYGNHGVAGAIGMMEAFRRSWDNEGGSIQQALTKGTLMSLADIEHVFGNIPDAAGRMAILNEVLTHPDFWEACRELERQIEDGSGFTTEQASKLAECFPQAYGDELLKKAQLAISAVWRAGMAKLRTQSKNANLPCELTASADYQIPNVLRSLGILNYADDLAEMIDQRQLIAPDGIDERALRGASLLAVEKLAIAQQARVADVDYWLWINRKLPITPHHLTITRNY